MCGWRRRAGSAPSSTSSPRPSRSSASPPPAPSASTCTARARPSSSRPCSSCRSRSRSPPRTSPWRTGRAAGRSAGSTSSTRSTSKRCCSSSLRRLLASLKTLTNLDILHQLVFSLEAQSTWSSKVNLGLSSEERRPPVALLSRRRAWWIGSGAREIRISADPSRESRSLPGCCFWTLVGMLIPALGAGVDANYRVCLVVC
ncbi:uncharacterized protein LOC123429973 isoform X2 [Hordeum vulgare subsp. vulgare]|uniref:Predicted protein n=1 Tax=Hordeum vulgare subsp. vulgare TaxID=112509 RepID=F2ECI9_HORVV|nr:uncharacterized protein LOC123429973 isoform X2 [Hordeum vulgare subsp. vulgare]BAK05061.1 predicted protein [Hordeum vulgare subsp. vulgare]